MLFFRSGFGLACSLVVVLGCDRAGQPLSPPRPEAERRADEREKIAQDFHRLAQFYKAYAARTKEPTTSGFWKYLDDQEQAGPSARASKSSGTRSRFPAAGPTLSVTKRTATWTTRTSSSWPTGWWTGPCPRPN